MRYEDMTPEQLVSRYFDFCASGCNEYIDFCDLSACVILDILSMEAT